MEAGKALFLESGLDWPPQKAMGGQNMPSNLERSALASYSTKWAALLIDLGCQEMVVDSLLFVLFLISFLLPVISLWNFLS